MYFKDLARATCTKLRDDGAKKPIHVPKRKFTISDDDGNVRVFSVKQTDKSTIYTIDDVERVLEACIYIIQECMKKNEPITVKGVGSLSLNYRKERRTLHPETKEEVIIPGHYLPKFSPNSTLKTCAKLYELSLADKLVPPTLQAYEFDDEEEEE